MAYVSGAGSRWPGGPEIVPRLEHADVGRVVAGRDAQGDGRDAVIVGRLDR